MEQRSGNPSRRSLVLGLLAVSGFAGACVLVLWSLMREPASSERVTPPQAALVPAAPGPGPASANQEMPPASQPAAVPISRQFIVTPLFDTFARFERRRSAELDFRVERVPFGLATGLDLTMSVLDVTTKKEARLRVRETGEGVYEAEFDAQHAGRYELRVAVPGAVAALARPVLLVVVDRVDEAVEPGKESAPGGNGGRESVSRTRRGDLGGASSRRGR